MHDPVSKVSMHGMLNSIISESIWGSITLPDLNLDTNYNDNQRNSEENNNKTSTSTFLPVDSWKIYSTIPSRNPPNDNLITYGEFLEMRTSLTRHERKALKTTFTEPGHVGEDCREYYENCLHSLCPTSTSCYHILPSFFHLLLTLKQRNLNFRIIFRTFGTDTHVVVEEYNLFCRGEHPHFSHSIDLSQYTLPQHAIARLFRSKDEVRLELQQQQQQQQQEV